MIPFGGPTPFMGPFSLSLHGDYSPCSPFCSLSSFLWLPFLFASLSLAYLNLFRQPTRAPAHARTRSPRWYHLASYQSREKLRKNCPNKSVSRGHARSVNIDFISITIENLSGFDMVIITLGGLVGKQPLTTHEWPISDGSCAYNHTSGDTLGSISCRMFP